MNEVPSYCEYVRTFLHRNGPNNGKRPMRFSDWCDWVSEDDGNDDYETHMRHECRMGRFV